MFHYIVHNMGETMNARKRPEEVFEFHLER